MKIEDSNLKYLKLVKELVYDKCAFNINNLKQNLESAEYEACTFELNNLKIEYRVSKITPKKIGQFVAIWKRNNNGVTEPFNILDDLDFIIITSKTERNFGQFIFPKSILATNGIITSNNKLGKRGIRVYPPWDIVLNKQAIKTQNWQTNYFFEIKKENFQDFAFLKTLLGK